MDTGRFFAAKASGFRGVGTWVVGVALAGAVLAPTAEAIRARVSLPNGDVYTGEWLRSDGSQFLLRLDDGQELQLFLPAGGAVQFFGQDGDVRPEATQRLRAAWDALALDLPGVAEVDLREAIALSPKLAAAHYELAVLLESQESSEASRHYVLAAQLDPIAYPITDKIQEEAAEYLAQDDYVSAAVALSAFGKAFPTDPYAPEAAHNAARYFGEHGGSAPDAQMRAVAAYEYALDTFPMHPFAEENRFALGKLYGETGDHGRADFTLTEFLTLYPGSPYEAQAHLALGYARLATGDTDGVKRAARWVMDHTSDEQLRAEALALSSEVAWVVYTTAKGLGHNTVRAVATDGPETWIGTVSGVTKLDLSYGAPQVMDIGRLARKTPIRSFAISPTHVWVGTSGMGLLRQDKVTGDVTGYGPMDGLPGRGIDAIAMDEAEVWVGGVDGLAKYTRATGTWETFTVEQGFEGVHATALVLTPESLWVGTKSKGVFRLDRQLMVWEAYSPRNSPVGGNSITSMTATDTGVVATWYTTVAQGFRSNGQGYSEWSDAEGVWTKYPTGRDDIAPEDMFGAYADGVLWIATGGLLMSRVANEWSSYEYPIDIRGSRIHSVTPDGQYVWIGSDAGVARVDTAMFERAPDGQ
jgi:TolA-binding protein